MTTKIPAERLETQFTDYKPGFDSTEATEEASRCLYCYDAPCITACPTSINIPQFINRIATGNVSGAAKTILDSNILGLSCARSCPVEVLCEGACVYNDLNKKPIAIGRLQRYAVESAYEESREFYKPGPSTGKRVALVGAGPASLACAHELRKLGHEATIFEKQELPGGLNTYGIAPYKMKAEVSLLEISRVEKIGVKIEYGRELGANLTLAELTEKFDAVFLGMGLGPDTVPNAPGSESRRIHGAVDLIARLKTETSDELAWISKLQSALIVGGGNTALDACRELKKLGVPRVMVTYRRGEKDMSGYSHEFKAARQEGVEFLFHTVPAAFATAPERADHCLQVKLQKTAIVDGVVKSLNEFEAVEAELVVAATGQGKLEQLLLDVSGVHFVAGRLQTDASGRTGNPKLFAGGDLANGGKEVVNAVAEGKRAALAIHSDLMKGSKSHG